MPEIVPLHAHIIREEIQIGEDPSSKCMTISLDTKYKFLDKECDDMAEVLILIADERFVKIEYLDEGIVDKMKREYVGVNDGCLNFVVKERKIIAFYQKVD